MIATAASGGRAVEGSVVPSGVLACMEVASCRQVYWRAWIGEATDEKDCEIVLHLLVLLDVMESYIISIDSYVGVGNLR